MKTKSNSTERDIGRRKKLSLDEWNVSSFSSCRRHAIVELCVLLHFFLFRAYAVRSDKVLSSFFLVLLIEFDEQSFPTCNVTYQLTVKMCLKWYDFYQRLFRACVFRASIEFNRWASSLPPVFFLNSDNWHLSTVIAFMLNGKKLLWKSSRRQYLAVCYRSATFYRSGVTSSVVSSFFVAWRNFITLFGHYQWGKRELKSKECVHIQIFLAHKKVFSFRIKTLPRCTCIKWKECRLFALD
jgi:hypothetical protein